MKDLFTKENIKKLIIAAVIAIAAYFGYNVAITPKTEVNVEVNTGTPVDSSAVNIDSL